MGVEGVGRTQVQARHTFWNLQFQGINNEPERKARERRKATVMKELETVGVFPKCYRNVSVTVKISTSLSRRRP